MERASDDGARPGQSPDRRQDAPLNLPRPAGADPGWDRVPVGLSEAKRLAASPQGGAFLALRADGADLLIQRVEGYVPEAGLALPVALALTALVAEALEPVHDQGGAWGELSPAGILFDVYGVLRIRPAPRQAPLVEPQGGAITPATDSLGLGGLLRYWLGGGWPSQALKATPEPGPLSALGVKVVLEGLSRSLPKLRLQPAGSARQAIYALLRRANLDGDQLLRDMLRARGLGVALRAWPEPVRLTARAAAVPELPRVTPTGLFAASQLLSLSPPTPAAPLFPAGPPREARPRSQALLRDTSPPPPAPEPIDASEPEELPELPRFVRPVVREVVIAPLPPAEREVARPVQAQPEVSEARASAPPRVVEVSEARASEPPRVVEVPEARASEPPRVVEVSEARASEPLRVVEVSEASASAPPRVVEVSEARASEPPRVVEVSEASASEPRAVTEVPEARASEPPRVVEVSEASASEPPRVTEVPEAPAIPPRAVTEVPEAPAIAPRAVAEVPEAPVSAPPPVGVVPPLPAPPPRQPVSLVGVHTTLSRSPAPTAPPTDFDDEEPTSAQDLTPPPPAPVLTPPAPAKAPPPAAV
ncbi:hypothetical protein L6R49_31490, partial [Myxococcota bacterium]|nr:hypothetical protein [Myxococcota bacterium]